MYTHIHTQHINTSIVVNKNKKKHKNHPTTIRHHHKTVLPRVLEFTYLFRLYILHFRCQPFTEGDSGSVIYQMNQVGNRNEVTIIGLLSCGGRDEAANCYVAISLDAAFRNIERAFDIEQRTLVVEPLLTLLAMGNFM